MHKVILYARKSTDVDDKQALSIEAQITELRAYANQESLHVVEELIEKQSAKIPGRPIFNAMLDRITKGEVRGILAWHPDRLARNSVDGGRIIYLLDCGHLEILKFPTFWSDNTSQGKFMLSIAFGQSKYYVDSLAENTKRGLRQKVRRGEYPTLAPLGYINDVRTKTVVQDKRTAPVIRRAFELYATNKKRLEDIAKFFEQCGIRSKNHKRLHRSRISSILSNPFYYGHFRYTGEIHEGKHQAVISKRLFDAAQSILQQRGRPHHRCKNEPKLLCGLFSCAECGMAITAEVQKGHVYYRCTKKRGRCSQPYVREEKLNLQLSTLLQTFALSEDWAEELREMMTQDETAASNSSAVFVQREKDKIRVIRVKLDRLLHGYLDQDIDRETYREQKANLLSKMKSLEERTMETKQQKTSWLEPMAKWLNTAENIPKIAQGDDLFSKKVIAKEIFGSNLVLAGGNACVGGRENVAFAPQNPWAAVAAAHELALKMPKSSAVVH